MSTKYVLAGGLDRAHPKYWDHLGQELALKHPVKVLSCFFSEPKKNWEEKFEAFVPFLKQAFGEDTDCQLADVERFLAQLAECDVLYLHDGTTHRLKSVLAQYGDLTPHFQGKVVIGSSAGANYLSRLGWSPSLRQPISGSGIVQLNVMVHYGSTFVDEDALGPVNWEDAQRQLENVINEGETITLLREGEFIIVGDEDN